MCFAPQGRALFRHFNFQKWSDTEVFCAFWLPNVLRATTACAFSTSQFLKVLRSWGALCILTWICASRPNGVSLIRPDGSAPAALASLLFDPPEPQIIWKRQCFATLLPFRVPASSFFWLLLFSDLASSLGFSPLLSSSLLFSFSSLLFSPLLFSSLTLPTSAFHLSILSEVWLLNFLRLVYLSINICQYILVYISTYCCIPVVPHKAVAEVSKIGNL